MRKWWLVAIIMIAVLIYGGRQTYVYVTNPVPATLTYAQFLLSNSTGKWVELTDCDLDYSHAISVKSRVLNLDQGTYIPVRPHGERGPARVLLKMSSRQLKAKGEDSFSILGSGGRFGELQRIQGMIASGGGDRDNIRNAFRNPDLVAADFVVLRADEEPSASGPISFVGLLVGAMTLISIAIRKSSRNAPPDALST